MLLTQHLQGLEVERIKKKLPYLNSNQVQKTVLKAHDALPHFKILDKLQYEENKRAEIQNSSNPSGIYIWLLSTSDDF